MIEIRKEEGGIVMGGGRTGRYGYAVKSVYIHRYMKHIKFIPLI